MLSPLDDDPVLKDIPLVEGWKVLPPVVLYAKIGQGGMGAVYRGRHLDFDIDVAVKCLKASLASEDEQFIARFKREARLAASLSHENLIRVYDSRRAHGLHYLVMEFVDGENLRARVTRKGPLEDYEAATILLGAARGLAKAHHHAETVVHRDVKPDNILISRRGEVKLADLGIAKALDQSDAATFNTQGVIGTPQYMAPEQWDRDQALGPQADVWSFGATLYYMLTAESGIRSGTQKQIYVDVCQKPFPDARRKRPDIDPALIAILEKCLQRDMNDRYADAGELAKALEAFIGHRPTTLDDPDTGSEGTIALVSPPPMPTMKRIRTHVEMGTGEAATPPPQMTTIMRKPRKKWPIVAGIAGVVVVAAIVAFKVFGTPGGTPPVGPVADATPPKLLDESPKDNDSVESGSSPTIKLFFDEELSSARISSQGGVFQDGTLAKKTAVFQLDAPSAAGMWKLDYEVTDEAGNLTKGILRYVSTAKVEPKSPRIVLTGPTEDVVYLKDTRLIVSGEVENPSSDLAVITLRVGGTPFQFPVAAKGSFLIDHNKIPIDQTSKVRVEYGKDWKAFEVVQDSLDPVLELVAPAGADLISSAESTDIEVKVTDPNLDSVELDGSPMTATGKNIWRKQAVQLARDGPISFAISATDKAGNVGKTKAVITRDTREAALQDARPAADTELVPGDKVLVALGFDEELRSARIQGQAAKLDAGKWQVSLTVPNGEGAWKVEYDAADLAGNHTVSSVAYSRKNKPAPASPVISLIGLPPPNGEMYVTDPSLAVFGTVENHAGDKASFLVDGTPVVCTIENGRLSADLRLTRNKRSKVELKYGGTSIVVFDVIQDSKEPVITPVMPATESFLTREASIDFQVRVVEDNPRSVLLDSREMKQDGKGIWRVDGLALPRDETFSFEVVATDKAGHTAKQTLAITRDTAPASLSADSLPKEGSEFAAGAPVEATLVFDEAIAAVIIGGRETVASDRAVKLTVTCPDVEGSWPLEGKVRDLAGNVGDFKLMLRRSPSASTSQPLNPAGTGSSIVVKDRAAPEGWLVVEPAAPGGRWAKKVQEPKSGIIFVLIEAGEFNMGSPPTEAEHDDEEKLHPVRLTLPFYLAVSETTQAEYRKLTGKSPSSFKGDTLPVEQVTWTEAVAFCQQIGCELPSEAQWEFACRAGSATPFHYGKSVSPKQANYSGGFAYAGGPTGEDRRKTISVKSFPSNAWGLHDMHGNVWEWCLDVYNAKAYTALKSPDDPVFDSKSKDHVVRGGAWNETAGACRAASRFKDEAGARRNYIGFRCAKKLPLAPK